MKVILFIIVIIVFGIAGIVFLQSNQQLALNKISQIASLKTSLVSQPSPQNSLFNENKQAPELTV